MSKEDSEIDIIKDFLKSRGYKNALEGLEKDDYKNIEKKKDISEDKLPKLTKLLQENRDRSKKYTKLQEGYKQLEKKHKGILQCARQIFSIVINCLQQLHNIKDGNQSNENLGETIENYKAQIGKYHKIIMSDEWDEKTEIMSQPVMMEHKKKLNKAKEEKNTENIIEVLLSLRVNALQISPELRKNLVYELIRNDILNIEETKSNQFVLDLLGFHAYNLRHATLSLISIISATYKGVEYLMSNGPSIVEKIIEIMKGVEDGQVIQRFCIAILQKMSVKEDTIPIYMKFGLIDWIIKLLQRSRVNDIHIFCLDFASALLANILHSNITLEYLENNISVCKNLTETFLSMIKENIPTSVLMHILICLSYLSKDRFTAIKEECKFYDRITEFVEYYSNIRANNESAEIDKRTVLDLCAHMFHPTATTMDMSEAMEINDMKYEDRIKEFETEQGDLIFECFQDEIS
jgi:hypothetical protein